MYVLVCTHCIQEVLSTARIGDADAERLNAHVRHEHPGLALPELASLGEVLSHFRVVIRAG